MHFITIISPDELKKLLKDSNTVIFDVRFSLSDTGYGERAYAQGHLPNAHYLHLDKDLSGPIGSTTGRHPLPDIDNFAECMRKHGVSNDSQVVILDDASGMFAARCWWLLKWLGHDRVAVLDGGWQAWLQADGSQTTDVAALPSRGDFMPRPRPELLVQADQVQQGLAQQTIVLCDARAPERYRGDTEPIDKVAGHVPGAINVPFAANLDKSGHFKIAQELAGIHARSSNKDKRVVHMCGSGVTACHNVLSTAIAGLPLPALYAGSWSEWITDPNRPVMRSGAQVS